jgi:hypothetical protein
MFNNVLPNTPIMLPNVQNNSIFLIYIFNVLSNNTPIYHASNAYNHSNYFFTSSMSFLAPLSYLSMSTIIQFLQKKIFRIKKKKINQIFAWFLIPLLSFLAFLSYLPIYSSVSPPFFFTPNLLSGAFVTCLGVVVCHPPMFFPPPSLAI